MPFYPDDASVPAGLTTDEFVLRPLSPSDVALDYDAVMASKAMLRVRMGGTWPRDDFTIDENLADLERHEADFQARTGFTYTVMNPTESECLGCVYVYPLAEVLRHRGADASAVAGGGGDEPTATFWVRSERIADDLDRRLLAALLPWLATEFAFGRVLFQAYATDDRQLAILRDAGLQPVASYAVGRRELLLFATMARGDRATPRHAPR